MRAHHSHVADVMGAEMGKYMPAGLYHCKKCARAHRKFNGFRSIPRSIRSSLTARQQASKQYQQAGSNLASPNAPQVERSGALLTGTPKLFRQHQRRPNRSRLLAQSAGSLKPSQQQKASTQAIQASRQQLCIARRSTGCWGRRCAEKAAGACALSTQ